jgi:LPXTG-site transpeptidase (sortase) family protein
MGHQGIRTVSVGMGRPARVWRRALAAAAVAALAAASLLATPAPGKALDKPDGVKPAATRLPAGHPEQAAGHEVGFITITAIDLDVTVRSGVAMSVIDRGPAHWAGTSLPGGSGNVVLAGHRTTKTRPFYYLNKLKPGDAIVMGDGTSFPAIYRVTETLIVDPQDVWITYDTGEPIVTLFACHPRGSARHRIVVRGALRTDLPIE